MLKTTIHSILVPLTLDEEGVKAIQQALCIRDKFYSHITLFYAYPENNILFSRFRLIARQRHRKQVFLQFRHFVEAYFGGDIPSFVKLKMQQGSLVKTLISQIHFRKYDLVVLNKNLERHASQLENWENGIKKVVGEAFCPVLTFNQNPCQEKIKNIMVPIDIRRPHKHNVEWAIEMARHHQAQIHLVSALNVNIKMEKSIIYKKVKTIERAINMQGLECESTIIQDVDRPIYEIIPEFINQQKPDLVLILTHQESILNSNHIGMLASEIIKNSKLPVFSITPRKETLITPIIEVMQTT